MPDRTPETETRAPRSTTYKAKVDAVFPASRRFQFERNERCFLGVSLENSNFVRPKLAGMLEWISRRFAHCTVLVGDSIHRITLEITRNLDPTRALEQAIRLGSEFVERELEVFERYRVSTEFSFLTCSAVQTTEAYARHYRALQDLLAEDTAFRRSVETFGHQYLGKHQPLSAERHLHRSTQYFLEEFAVFACLYDAGVPVMIYPGSFSTLAELAEGQHPDAPVALQRLIVVSLKLRGRS